MKFDFIVGNPPYLSSKYFSKKYDIQSIQKEIINNLQDEIGEVKLEIKNNSDLFVYIFLQSFCLLNEKGQINFLCSDKWLQSVYGNIIKEIFSGDTINIISITQSNFYPFFEEETNAITTLISKTKQDNFILNDIVSPWKNSNFVMDKTTIHKSFFSDKINLRTKLLHKDKNPIETNTCISDLVEIKKAPEGFKDIEKRGLLSEDKKDTILFYNKQARVNKPGLYMCNYTEIMDDMPYRVKNSKHIYENVTYLAKVVDMFPLVFETSGKTAATSKYFPLVSKNFSLPVPILIHNFIFMINIELFGKIETKRSATKNRNGSILAIDRLDKIKVPSFNSYSNDVLDKLKYHYNKYKNIIIKDIYEALENKDFVQMNKIIMKEEKLDYQETKKILLSLVDRRQRDLKRLGLPLMYA